MRHEERILKTFEELEREELRRSQPSSTAVNQMIESLFGAPLEAEDGAPDPFEP
jgi:hypothetical protein